MDYIIQFVQLSSINRAGLIQLLALFNAAYFITSIFRYSSPCSPCSISNIFHLVNIYKDKTYKHKEIRLCVPVPNKLCGFCGR